MNKKILTKATALLTCLLMSLSVTACGGGSDSSVNSTPNSDSATETVKGTITVDPLTASELGAGFNATYLPNKKAIKQLSGKIDVSLDFEGTQEGWKALAKEYERLQGGDVVVNINTEFSGSRYSERLNAELKNMNTDWDIVEGNLGYGSTQERCIMMTAGIDAYNPYCGENVQWSSVLQPAAYRTKEAATGEDTYILNSEIMQTCWFVNDVAFDEAVAKGYLNADGEAEYPITWDDLIYLCECMEEAGYSNPLGITLCNASIDSLQFTWLLRVYGDYYYRQFYQYIMGGEAGTEWAGYDPLATVVENNTGYGVQYAKLLNMMFEKDCGFGKGYVGLTSEVYLDFVGNLAKMKGHLMNNVDSTEFGALRDEFETQAHGKQSPQIILDYQGFGITYDKSDKLELGYFDYPQMIAGKYKSGEFAGQDIVDNENTITRDIGGNGGFLSIINHTNASQNELNKDFIKFVMSPYGQTIYYKGLAAAGEVPKGLTSVKNELVVFPAEWKAFFNESSETITFSGDVDANPFLSWGVRYAIGYRETQNVIRDYWKGLLMTGLSANQTLTVNAFASKWDTAVRADLVDIVTDNGWAPEFWKNPNYNLG
ncbi:MAG: hypothetical protein E7371_01200 [Clostridiales bacterium]|nr:hypothetical protein [Clostridiales bacterium]